MSELVLCDGCARHVHAAEMACPFCGAPVLGSPKRGRAGGARTRAALFYLGVSLAACDDGSTTQPVYGSPPVPVPEEAIAAPYGAPPDPPPPEPPEPPEPPSEESGPVLPE